MARSDAVLKMLITGDAKDAVKASKEAADASEHMGSRIGKAGLIAAAAMAGIATATVGTALKMASGFQDIGSQVGKLERLTGGTAEQMSVLRYQAEATGVDTDTLGKGIKTLSSKLESSKDSVKQYGVALKDSSGHTRSMNEILPELSEQFANMPDGIEKNALATKLFGRAGLELIPMLNKGKDGLSELSDEATKYGLVLSEDQVKAAKEAKKSQRELGAAFDGVKIAIGEHVLPIVTKLTTWFAQAIPVAMAIAKKWFHDNRDTIREWGDKAAEIFNWVKKFVIEQVFPRLVAAVKTAIAVIKDIGEWLGKHKEVLVGVAAMIATLLVAAFVSWAISAGAAAIATLAAAWPIILIIAVIGLLVAGILYAWNHFKWFQDAVKAVWHAIQEAISFAWDNIIKPIWDLIVWYITNILIPEFKLIWSIIQFVFGVIGDIISFAWNSVIKPVFGLLMDGVHLVIDVFNGISDVVSSVWNGVVDIIKGAINGVIGLINGFIDLVNDIQVHIHVGFINLDFDGLKLPKIPRIHTGGYFSAPNGTDEGLALLQTGERVIPAGETTETNSVRPMTTNVAPVYNINVNVSATADKAEIGRTIVETIAAYERRSGVAWRTA